MAQTTQVLELLLTARYVGGPAFHSMARDIDTLVNSTSGLAKVGASMSLVGTAMTAAGIGVASFVGESIKQYDQYNAAVNRLVAVHALGANQVQQFNQTVMQTSNQFGQNSTDIANGLYVIMSGMKALGYTANDVFKTFNVTVNGKTQSSNLINSIGAFVAASGNGLPGSVTWDRAASDVIHIGSAFSLPMKQWPTMMGQMTAVENSAGITQQNLVQGVLRATSTANELGIPPSELFALIGAEGTAGVFQARAGTELAAAWRNMLTNKNAVKALGSIGLSPNQFWSKNGQLMDQGTMLGLIYSHLAGVSPQKRFSAESAIFGAVGNRALGQLMNPKTLEIYQRIMNQEVNNPVGNMFGVAGQQLVNFQGAVSRLHQAVLNLMKTVGGPLATAIQPLITNLANLITRLDNFLVTPKGQNLLTHAPQLLFGSAAGLLTAGPALSVGGGWLRDFATQHDTAHAKSLERLTAYTDRTALGRTFLEQNIAGQRQNLAERIALAMTGGGGGGARRTLEQQTAELLRPRSTYWNTLGDQRMQYILPYLNHTRTGLVAARGADPLLQRAVQDATTATGPGAGFARRRAWDYINSHWDTVAQAYGVDLTHAPDPQGLLQSMLRQPGQQGPNRALQRLQLQQQQFERRSAQQLEQYDVRAAAGAPHLEKSAGELLKGGFGKGGSAIWGLGTKLSPYHIIQRQLQKHFPNLKENAAHLWKGGIGHLQTAMLTHQNWLAQQRPVVGHWLRQQGGNVKHLAHAGVEHAKSAVHFLSGFDTEIWPRVRSSIASKAKTVAQAGISHAKAAAHFINTFDREVWPHMRHAVASRAQSVATAAVGHAKAAAHFVNIFDREVWPNVRHAVATHAKGLAVSGIEHAKALGTGALEFGKALPGMALRGAKAIPGLAVAGAKGAWGAAWSGGSAIFKGAMNFIPNLLEALKNIGPAIMSAIGSVLSFGSVLLPIIAIVLLVVGAITIGVLIFTRFRKQALDVAHTFQQAFAPIFKMVMGVVMSTLNQVKQAWAAHSKEINHAMLGLMSALKQSAPFFVMIGAVIGAVIVIIVKVIGYLVKAFISALPYIINVFSSLFKFLGDLGNIVMAVIHGKWGLAWKYAKQAVMDAWGIIKNLVMMLWTFLSSVFSNLWKDIGPTMKSLWNNVTKWFGGLGGAIQHALVQALANLGNALHKAVAVPIQNAVHNAVASIPGGAWAAHKAGVPGFATGGYVDSSMFAWVGETGRELVKLPGGSRVYNHLDSINMVHHDASQSDPAHEARQRRSTAEEYFFARAIQREREAVWDRYSNTSREFDSTYRRAYQYYG